MNVGYTRVSRQHQRTSTYQRGELEAAGCERIFEAKVSSTKERRPVLKEALDYLRAGDVLVVWRLNRLGRSLKERRSSSKWWATWRVGGGVRKPQRVFGDHHPGRQAGL